MFKRLSLFMAITICLMSVNITAFGNENNNGVVCKTTNNLGVCVNKWASSEKIEEIIYARAKKVKSRVAIEGTITAQFGSNLYVQDDTGAILVRLSSYKKYQAGTKVHVEGKRHDYYGLKQIKNPNISVVRNSKAVPMTINKGLDESLESRLVKIQDIHVEDMDKYGNYTVTTRNHRYVVEVDKSFKGFEFLELDEDYDSLIGVVTYSYGKYKIKPRKFSDLIISHKEILDNIKTYEIQGRAHGSKYKDKIVSNVEGIVTGKLNLVFDKYSKPKVIYRGVYIQDLIGDGDENTSDALCVLYEDTDKLQVGDKVKVSGVVKEYKKYTDFYAYDIENQLTVTSIVADEINIESHNNKLPEPVVIGEGGRKVPKLLSSKKGFDEYNPSKYAIDFYESLEGMLVKVNCPLIIGPGANGDIPIVADDGISLKDHLTKDGGALLEKDDNNLQKLFLHEGITKGQPHVKPGDKFKDSIVGIIDYSWGNYKLFNTEPLPKVEYAKHEEDVSKINVNEDILTIAEYNLYNFSGERKHTRGLAENIVKNLKTPDIIGVIEMQDNDGKKKSQVVDANENYEKLIENIKDLSGVNYKYTDINPVKDQEGGQPGGNIRVGYIYNSDKVTLVEGKKGKSTEEVTILDNGNLSLNPGRIGTQAKCFKGTRKSLAVQFKFKGEDIFVIGNHFNSKRGDNPIFGNVQPIKNSSEIQRTEMAQVVNSFVQKIQNKKPNANIVVLGDMNDFHFSDAVLTLKGNELENMIDYLPKNERYTYIHEGNSQVLDNILVSKNLVNQTEIDVVNINTIYEKNDSHRFSDHDPVIIGIDFSKNN